uniref:Pre-mRNA-splicing factor 38 n=1 Tax=Timema poppense TaxID=170557 RepID=A0A7R9GWR4_TIMPO|nr:unnamed protein product [Timema poppensis]
MEYRFMEKDSGIDFLWTTELRIQRSQWGNNSSPGAGDEEKKAPQKFEKKNNSLPLWGNERTMNLNPLILTNIQSSHYFKVNLYELKTYHEVIDEIYYKVTHLEPWEKGSRKTAGQTGMCGGVRGVGAGGIVSTAYCLLYKLFTLKLTRKQINGLITHPDSPYIRGLGFMYIRYTQPPADLWDWYDQYLEDPEELDVKAGGGQTMTVGDMLRAFLTKLNPCPNTVVPVVRQPKIPPAHPQASKEARHIPDEEMSFGEAERFSRLRRTDDRPSPNKDRRNECLFTNKERRNDRLSPTKERRSDRLSPSKERRNDRLSPSKERRNDRLSPAKERRNDHLSLTKERRNDRLSPNKERRSNRPLSRERSPLSRHRQHSPPTKHRSHQRPRSGEIQRTRDIKDR